MRNILGTIAQEENSSHAAARLSFVVDLSETEYDKFLEARQSIQSFIRDVQLYKVAIWNYEEYREIVASYISAYIHKNERHFDRHFLDINRCLLNFLASFRTYLDHTETGIKRRHGKSSTNIRRFKQYCSKAYDNSFSYRFIYRLRNYGQHCGLPLNHMEFGATVENNNFEQPIYSVEIGCVTKKLLENFDWGPLSPELNDSPPIIVISPHLEQVVEHLEEINRGFVYDEMLALKDHAVLLSEFVDRVSEYEGTPCLLENYIEDEDEDGLRTWRYGLYRIPVDLVEIIKNRAIEDLLSLVESKAL